MDGTITDSCTRRRCSRTTGQASRLAVFTGVAGNCITGVQYIPDERIAKQKSCLAARDHLVTGTRMLGPQRRTLHLLDRPLFHSPFTTRRNRGRNEDLPQGEIRQLKRLAGTRMIRWDVKQAPFTNLKLAHVSQGASTLPWLLRLHPLLSNASRLQRLFTAVAFFLTAVGLYQAASHLSLAQKFGAGIA